MSWRASLREGIYRLLPVLADVELALRDAPTYRWVREDAARIGRIRAALGDMPASPDAKTALLLCLQDWRFETKLLSSLALGLRMRGWRIVVVTHSRSGVIQRRYAQAFGADDIVYLGEIDLDKKTAADCRRAAKTFMARSTSFSEIKAWEFEGSWIGPQVLSSVSRSTYRGAPDPSDPETHAQIRALLPVVLTGVPRARELLKLVQPTLALTIEANYARYGPIVDMAIANGVDVIQVQQPWRDDALMCKRLTAKTRRLHYASVDPMTLHKLSQLPWTDKMDAHVTTELNARYEGRWFLQSRNQPGTRSFTRDELFDHLDLDPSKKTAVVFSHVLWDANLFYGRDLFEDYGDWFVQTVRAAADSSQLNWIIKMHPANLWKRESEGVTSEYSEIALIRDAMGALPEGLRFLYPDTPISSLSLYAHADYGLTVRGTPGMEMACFGKRVITAGTGRYSNLGFTTDPPTREAYLDIVGNLQDLDPPSVEETMTARRHAYAVFRLRPWKMRSLACSFTAGDPSLHDVNVVAGSLDEIEAKGDLGDWAQWATGTDIDYVDTKALAEDVGADISLRFNR